MFWAENNGPSRSNGIAYYAFLYFTDIHKSKRRAMPYYQNGDSGFKKSDRSLVLTLGLNLLITVAELIGGILSASLALISDALHNFSDAASVGITLGARRISRKDADKQRTFGYSRAEVISGFVNLITLILVSLYLVVEAVIRFIHPQPINGGVMFVVATIGLVANVASTLLLHNSSRENINLRSIYIHLLSDAFSSMGVIIAGLLILKYHLYIIDTILTLLIAAYILIESIPMLREIIHILMESSPQELAIESVVTEMSKLDGVKDIHHVHIWNLDEKRVLLEAHVRIDKEDLDRLEQIKRQLKLILSKTFGIQHSTLEFELQNCHGQPENDCMELTPESSSIP